MTLEADMKFSTVSMRPIGSLVSSLMFDSNRRLHKTIQREFNSSVEI